MNPRSRPSLVPPCPSPVSRLSRATAGLLTLCVWTISALAAEPDAAAAPAPPPNDSTRPPDAPAPMPLVAPAPAPGRARKTDIALTLDYQPGTTLEVEGGTEVEMGNCWLVGLDLGYVISDHWRVGMETTFGATHFRRHSGPVLDPYWSVYAQDDVSVVTLKFTADWYPLKGRLTPFLTAGLGMYCLVGDDYYYDDYWGWGWGYEAWGPSDLGFLGSIGGGLRWDIGTRLSVKVGGGGNAICMGELDEAAFFPTGFLRVSCRF